MRKENPTTAVAALMARSQFAEAASLLEVACRNAPERLDLLSLYSIATSYAGDIEKALGIAFSLVQKAPNIPEYHANLGMLMLKNGSLATGFSEYQWRLATNDCVRLQERFNGKLWQGEPIHGQHILLIAEQGFGDTIQFIRLSSLVAKLGARVTIEVPKKLFTLFQFVADDLNAKIVTASDDLPSYDWICPLLSLPLALRLKTEDLSPPPYLKPNPEAVAAWDRRLSQLMPREIRRIGLAWKGGNDGATAMALDHRAVNPALLAPLTKTAGTRFVSLQVRNDKNVLPAGMNIIDFTADLHDFADSAALIAALDLVITVDTSVAHLAGAIDHPVWILLCQDACWRWQLDKERSLWYPSAELFRQSIPGDWTGPLHSIERKLNLFT